MLASDADIQHGSQLRAGAIGESINRADDRFRKSSQMPGGFAPDVRACGELLGG
jgi:hypothetical protein